MPLLALAIACANPALAPDEVPVGDVTVDATGSVMLVEFVDVARRAGPTVSTPHAAASVAAYRQARQGESGAVLVRTPTGDQFMGVLHQTVETSPAGEFDLQGLRPGELYVVMLVDEPKRGGCIGSAGMVRSLRVYPGVPVAPIQLNY